MGRTVTVPLIFEPGGRAIPRSAFFGQCARLAARLNAMPAMPLMPLCRRRQDVMASIVAANASGRDVILPNDAGGAAVAQIADQLGAFILVLSEGDPAPDVPLPTIVLGADEAPAAASPHWHVAAAITLYTSGSTGTPVAHRHPLEMFLAGVPRWAERLDLGDAPATIVATVPSQHMFGLEATVMLPLHRKATAVYDGRPFYPMDVHDALKAIPTPRVLVTTPVHLIALVREGMPLPPLHCIVSATAPLSRELAEQAEALFGAPVFEIYGSTETGMAASRRTARTDVFTLRDDLELEVDRDGALFHGAHLARPAHVADLIQPVDDGFRLLGRGADMANVAGKRASLAGLTATLTGIDGVEDGVMVLPESSCEEVARPVAVVVAPTMTPVAVRAALRERLPEVFVPRRVLLVDALPRDSVGKLPAAAVAALLDGAPATFTIPADHPSIDGHFPGNPMVPGAVALDHTLAAAGLAAPISLVSVKFKSMLRAGETCTVETGRGRRGLTAVCRVGEREILSAVIGSETP